MTRLLFLLTCCIYCLCSSGQGVYERHLDYYIEAAKANSPFINDYSNQAAMQQAELERLKSLYTHSRLVLNGDYLFVPVISKDGRHTSFKWNAQDGTDYYGYDLGESSGHVHAGITFTKPLLGKSSYKAAQEQAGINTAIANNNIRMKGHELERTVTEQYLLCLLDKTQIDFTDSVCVLLEKKYKTVQKLVRAGLSKQSDLHLLAIEQAANEELRTACKQSYDNHLTDLNILCGISDTNKISLADAKIKICSSSNTMQGSLFTEQFRLDSMNTAASLHSFNLQYKPRLDLFVNGGLQSGAFSNMYRHIGLSAGLTFSWTISDGKQRKYKEQQAEWQWNSIRNYRNNAELQRRVRLRQCLDEMKRYDERRKTLEIQMTELDNILDEYSKEMNAGQVSVLDYITVLRNKIQAEKDILLLKTNRQLVVAAYNYWNW